MRVLKVVASGLLWSAGTLASVCKPSPQSSPSSPSVSSTSSSIASSSHSLVSPASSSSSILSSSLFSVSSVSPTPSSFSSASSSSSIFVSSSPSISSSSPISSSSSSAIPACSVNVVTNGDFSTGDLTGWTYSTTGYGQGVVDYDASSTYPYYLHFSTTTSGSSSITITQVMDTVSGETYAFSLDYLLYVRGALPTISCHVNNVYTTTWTMLLTSTPLNSWKSWSQSYLASSSSTTLTCTFSTSTTSVIYIADIASHQECSD
ncbi:hypothetical protein SEUCBS139899_003132 [Sporothrix eucalyptigena]